MNVDEKIKTAELKKEALERNRQGLKKKKKKQVLSKDERLQSKRVGQKRDGKGHIPV